MQRFEEFRGLRGVIYWVFSAAILGFGSPVYAHAVRLSPTPGLGSAPQQAGREQLAGMGEMKSGGEADMGDMGGMGGAKGGMGDKSMQQPPGDSPTEPSRGPMPHASPGKGASPMEKHMDEMHRHMEKMQPPTSGGGAPGQPGGDTGVVPAPDSDM